VEVQCDCTSTVIDLKSHSVRRDVLYGIITEFCRLIKIFLNETYSKVRIYKHLSDAFPIQNGLKKGDALSPLL
jgi:hypothetical protein